MFSSYIGKIETMCKIREREGMLFLLSNNDVTRETEENIEKDEEEKSGWILKLKL